MRPLLVLLAFALGAPQDPCGNPMLVSQGYTRVEGKVLGVLDPVTLLVEVSNPPGDMAACSGKPCKIRLVNLDPPATPALAATARRFMLNRLGKSKRVDLLVSPVQDGADGISALVFPKHYLRGRYDMTELLLDSGLGTYRSFGPYAVDWYLECRQKRAEERAKDGRRGLWYGSRTP